MKKHLLVTVIFILTKSFNLFGQNVYNDVLTLKMLNPIEDDGKLTFGAENEVNLKAAKILAKYINPNDSSSYDTILKVFLKNPFLGLPILGNSSDNNLKFFVKGISSSLSGLGVTTLADGLAQFMIQRANEEINVWFFRKFKEDLDASIELRTIFPVTNSFIQITEPYQYAQNLHLLREAFKKDLAEIIDNLESLAALEKYQKWFESPSELKVIPIGLAGASIVSKIKNGTHPAEVINSLGRKEYLKGVNDNLYSGMNVLSILSQSLRSDNTEIAYVSHDMFKANIIDDDVAFRIYLGLVYQQMDSICISSKEGNTTVQDFLKFNKEKILASKNIGLELLTKLNSLENNFRDLKTKSDTSEIRYNEWYNFYGSVIDVVEFGLDVSNTLGIKTTDKTPEYKKFLFSAKKGNEIFKNISEENYSLAVLNFSIVYDTLVFKPVERETQKKALTQENKNFLDSVPPSSKFIKYGAFMAAVADAEKPEDVKAALNAAALPAGSSSIKRQTPFNVSINSYLGFHIGEEKLEGKGWGAIRGVSAPVGLAFSTKIEHWPFRESGSISIFGSIIDIGAVASFRLTNNEGVEELPEMKLENIIAPGAYLVYGIPKAPISIGYGWQRGPQLRAITSSTPVEGEAAVITYDLANGYRWNFFIAVDIPLFNLYTKSN